MQAGSKFEHQPVLLQQVIDALNIKPDGVYIDATFGRGGHSAVILEHLDDNGRLLAVDQDPQAVAYGRRIFDRDNRIEIVHGNFMQVANMALERGLDKNVDGVLMDLGVSSPQLDDAARGFSFSRSGPLDMRMNPEQGRSAMEWLASVSLNELTLVLKKYGEERSARRIAEAIIKHRKDMEITDTKQLADIIVRAVPGYEKQKHPATRSFQAIRIFINQELQALEQGLQAAVSVLAVAGRLAVISFHSLEDRIVKRFMRDISNPPRMPPGLPIVNTDLDVPFRLVSKPVVAIEEEIKRNPRARSARLRILERVL
ncbi:MAG: 16S rRNA (cytosine(1402)-N(4))-methyltransferase RsmH [Gammaproteobacteria bacterium]|nr:16S rRNA (cytosine(1402)-N(4))-methyltransferase RsmH [Gammaproteobacteria bacterium]NNJ97106.1 16S rRNA (cytosine(1402)-N(4))-methyltransferase RsmH [Gammaproteobacteria bacterium]